MNPESIYRVQFSNSQDGFQIVIASEAKQSMAPQVKAGLLRRFAPRNDGI